MLILTSLIIATVVLANQFNIIVFAGGGKNFASDFKPSGEVKGVLELAGEDKAKSEGKNVIFVPPEFMRPKTPAKNNVYTIPPEITASSAVVFDLSSRKILYEKNGDDIASIASITKLMTALVVLDQKPDFTKEYAVSRGDRRNGGRVFLFPGDRVSIDDLFNVSLVGSGNTETIALVHSLGMTEADFVSKMNAKAAQMGLRKTIFADPIGLNENNKSTAYELIEVASAAFSQPKIQKAVLSEKYIFKTKQGKTRAIQSTDDLLNMNTNYKVLGGKTGYIGSAGFCFIGKFQNSEGKNDIVSVVLGSSGVDLRFIETDKLVNWVYENYTWPEN